MHKQKERLLQQYTHSAANVNIKQTSIAVRLRYICDGYFAHVYMIVALNSYLYIFIRLKRLRELVEHGELATERFPSRPVSTAGQLVSVWSSSACSCVLNERL